MMSLGFYLGEKISREFFENPGTKLKGENRKLGPLEHHHLFGRFGLDQPDEQGVQQTAEQQGQLGVQLDDEANRKHFQDSFPKNLFSNIQKN